MSNSTTPPNLCLNVFINRDKTKVLFAEASSDFINVLLSFLTIPLGKIVSILQKHSESAAIGSLTTLYKGLSELDAAHFSAPGAKEMLLNPRTSFRVEWRKLAVDVADNAPLQYFRCSYIRGNCFGQVPTNLSMYSDVATCSECGRLLNEKLSVEENLDDEGEAEAFVVSPSFFIIADDLRVAPAVDGTVQTLIGFGITDTQGAEMKALSLGLHEVCELLKLSLTSATPLTDMVMKNTMENPQSGIWLDHTHQHDAATESRKLVLRAFFHKSTNKFLFAEATDEFIELVFSFMAIPLGGVEFLLGGDIGLKSIDNLYRSVSNGIDDKYFTTSDTKNRLINPKLPHGYLSKTQLLPLSEEDPPKLYFTQRCSRISFSEKKRGLMIYSFKSIKEVFVKKQTMCFVSDDLTMSPSLATRISILNDARIPLSNVKGTEFHIGLNEALGILKASLISKTALTDGLIKPMLKKEPKKEPKEEPTEKRATSKRRRS